jgi:hypothetical protein
LLLRIAGRHRQPLIPTRLGEWPLNEERSGFELIRSIGGTMRATRPYLFGEFHGYVPPETNVPVLRAAFARSGNRDTSIVVFPRANHRFEVSSRRMIRDWVIGSRYLPEYYQTMAEWLDRRVTRKR